MMKKIDSIRVNEDMKVSELVEGMNEMGFGARKIGEASEILKEMINNPECKVFLGLAGAMVPAGMKKIIVQMLDHTSIFVSTGANLTHDLIEALGHHHYRGEEKADDGELNKKGIDRIYNVFMKNDVYKDLEKFFDDNWEAISKCKDTKELLWKLGELLEVSKDESILKKCWEDRIPIFCPALADSGIGLMIWGNKVKGKEMIVDAFEDMNEIIDFSWQNEVKGVIYVGGGVPKNFIQQSMQFSTPASYGIQITTEREASGGSSGAPLREGVSWGKMRKEGRFVNVNCDATVVLPLIYGAIGK